MLYNEDRNITLASIEERVNTGFIKIGTCIVKFKITKRIMNIIVLPSGNLKEESKK
ncbi:MAG: hypothetical protein IKD76_01390 [Clostridia bacterium]|nr:hypothetical protein [Clostridia bacterium]